jgi:drug/metabolite transporter (DMT)-like permease
MAVPVVSAMARAFRLWMLLPLLGLLWGSSYLWIDILGGTFAPSMVILLRTVASLVVMGTLVLLGRGRLPQFGVVWLHLLVVTIAADLVPFFMLVWAQQHVDSSVAAVLNSTIPLFTLVIAVLVFRSERFTGERLAGIVLGMAGVAALSGTGDSSGALLSPGVVAVTLSSVFYGFGFVYARRYVRGDPFGIVALQMVMGLPLLVPITLLTGSLRLDGFTPKAFMAVIGLGIMSSGLAYALYYKTLDRLGPTTTSYATYLSPVVAMLLGWGILGERIGLLGYVGILLVAFGVLTASGLGRAAVRRCLSAAGVATPVRMPEPVPIVEEAVAESA